MSNLLVSLHSALSTEGGIGIVDENLSLRYLQVEKSHRLVKNPQIRGVYASGNRIYALTQASLRIYKIVFEDNDVLFKLMKEVVLHEWIQGGKNQADLHSLYICKLRNSIFVGNKRFSSLDELDMDGKFIRRHYLWDIAPEYFVLPQRIQKQMNFGEIRGMAKGPDGDVLITVAFCNDTTEGVVISFNTGKLVLKDLDSPHGGLLVSGRYYLLDMINRNLTAYKTIKDKNGYYRKDWSSKPVTEIDGETVESGQSLRGISNLPGELICGVCDLGKPVSNQFKPRVVSFDPHTGKQLRESVLPDLLQFQQPRIFSICGFPYDITFPKTDDLIFYFHGERKEPKSYVAEIDAVMSSREYSEQDRPKIIKDSHNRRKFESFSNRNNLPLKEAGGKNNQSSTDEGGLKHDEINTSELLKIDPVVIDVKGVSLCYQRRARSWFSWNKNLRTHRETWALKNITFSIRKGEVIGLIGRNGSGKSTLSMLLAGIFSPDTGTVTVKSRAQLLALGAGFRNELTGSENVYLNGTLLGLTRSEVALKMDDICEFAELHEFIDEPVNTYSAGMRSRLAFAIATAVEPGVLILDEVMSTGDQAFSMKAQLRMQKMRESAQTVVMVSHNPAQLKKMCTRVIWLEKGEIVMDGDPKTILSDYTKFSQNTEKWISRHPGLIKQTGSKR
jgi:ABC-type polysaccharide/polyol phosphate transport system ATPase subunit